MLSACTSTGILPTAWTASVWKRTPFSWQILPISRDGLDDADFVVGVHDGDEDGLVGAFGDDGALEVVEVDEAVGLDGQVGDDVAHLLELLAGVEDGLVLGDLGDDVVAALAVHLGDALDGEVVGLGGAGGEDDLLGGAPMSLAICSRAASTAFSASQPNWWLRLAALPNLPVK